MGNDTIYTVAVAGMGKRGVHHAQAMADNPRFKLVGVCDIDQGRVDAAKDKFNVEYGSTDTAQMLRETKPDVFVFCTLPFLRLPFIQAGVDAGVKLIAYEKPISMNFNEAHEMYRLIRQAGIKTVVSHQHRYGEHYQKVKEIIASGVLGRVHTVYGHATGWMMHMMSHMVDYASWYNDYADVEWVVGQADGVEKFSDLHASPDYITALIQYSNGVRGIIEVGEGAPDVPEVEAWWRKCRIGAQGTEGFAEVLTGGGWRAVTKSGGYQEGPGGMDYDHDMPLYIQEMVDWLDDDSKVHPCNGENAYKGHEIMMAAVRSVIQRGKVTLPLQPGEEPELDALKAVLSK